MITENQKQGKAHCSEERTTTQVVKGGVFGDLAVSAINGKPIRVEIRQNAVQKKTAY